MLLSRSTHLRYELTYKTDETTEETGSIQMQCRDANAEPIPLSGVKFWLNRTSACDPSIQERHDFNVVEVDSYWISFNLTRCLEGIYTCGTYFHESGMLESSPKKLICKYWINKFAYYKILTLAMHNSDMALDLFKIRCANLKYHMHAYLPDQIKLG